MAHSIKQFLFWLKSSYLWNSLIKVQRFILFCTTSVMVGILGLVVLFRYIFRADLFGYDEIIMISAFWMYFIGSSYAMERREHVRADILERVLPHKIKRYIRLLSNVCQTVIALATAELSIAYIINGIKIWPTTSAWGLPMITSMSAVTIGFCLMTFYVIVQCLEEFVDPQEGEN